MGNNNSIVLLVTAVNRHKGTQSITEYSGIFAVNRNSLDEVEKTSLTWFAIILIVGVWGA